MAESQGVLKDIEERLVYVMSTKEAAVQQTLADTEESLATIGELKALFDMMQKQNGTITVMGVEFLPQASSLLERLQDRLMHILMTQGYQDLTGQVLKRVLGDLSTLAESPVTSEHSGASLSQGFGPSVLAAEKKEGIGAQDDVDDLLKSLGI